MSDLSKLAGDLRQAGQTVSEQVRKVASKAGVNMKADARKFIEEQRHHEPTYLPHYPRSITYDLIDGPDGTITVEVGPDSHMSQGPLGNILENGSIRSRPYPHLKPALDLELPRADQVMADLGEQLLAERK